MNSFIPSTKDLLSFVRPQSLNPTQQELVRDKIGVEDALDDWVVTWDSIENGTLPVDRLPSVVARRDLANTYAEDQRVQRGTSHLRQYVAGTNQHAGINAVTPQGSFNLFAWHGDDSVYFDRSGASGGCQLEFRNNGTTGFRLNANNSAEVMGGAIVRGTLQADLNCYVYSNQSHIGFSDGNNYLGGTTSFRPGNGGTVAASINGSTGAFDIDTPDYKVRLYGNASGPILQSFASKPLYLNPAGNDIVVPSWYWIRDSHNRIMFGGNSSTYVTGQGSTPIVIRNAAGVDVARNESNGDQLLRGSLILNTSTSDASGSIAAPARSFVDFRSTAWSYSAGRIEGRTYAANLGYGDLVLSASPLITVLDGSNLSNDLVIRGNTGNVELNRGALTVTGRVKANYFRFGNDSYFVSDGTFNYSMDEFDAPKALRAKGFWFTRGAGTGASVVDESGNGIYTTLTSGDPWLFVKGNGSALGIKAESIVISDSYLDVAPTNGLFVKGNVSASRVIVPNGVQAFPSITIGQSNSGIYGISGVIRFVSGDVFSGEFGNFGGRSYIWIPQNSSAVIFGESNDIGLQRISSNEIEINNGVSVGTLRDLSLRNLTANGVFGFSNARFENPSSASAALKTFETSLSTWQEPWRGQASATGARIAFLGATPIIRQTLPAAATDAATTQTLANALRTLAINFGLAN